MSQLSIDLPSDLVARLESAAGPAPGAKDQIVREALEQLLDERLSSAGSRKATRGLNLQPFPDGLTFGDLTEDICGKYEGPGDLSTNPDYMEGFGED